MGKLGSLFMACTILLSCSKKSDRDLDTSTLVAFEATRALIISTDVFHSCLRAGQHTYENSFSPVVNGGAIWSDTTSTSHLSSIDFGSAGVTGTDSRIRSGKMILSSVSNFLDSLSFASIQLQSYTLSGSTSSGLLSLYSKGRDSGGHKNYELIINSGALFTIDSASRIDWNGQLQFSWINGDSTPSNSNDDTFSIQGKFNITTANSEVEITLPLLYDPICGKPDTGKMIISPESISVRSIDYGNGSCDPTATVTINGSEFEISFF